MGCRDRARYRRALDAEHRDAEHLLDGVHVALNPAVNRAEYDPAFFTRDPELDAEPWSIDLEALSSMASG